MDDEFAGESFESCTKCDRAGTIVISIWQSDRILPAAQWIVFSQFDAIDLSNQKRIDMDVEGVDSTRIVVDCPLFLGAKRNAVLDFPVVRLTIDSKRNFWEIKTGSKARKPLAPGRIPGSGKSIVRDSCYM